MMLVVNIPGYVWRTEYRQNERRKDNPFPHSCPILVVVQGTREASKGGGIQVAGCLCLTLDATLATWPNKELLACQCCT